MPAKPFVLAVKAVIFDEQGRCLLVRRSLLNQYFVGGWEWPGGKVNPGEDFADAVVRETLEETSLEIEITGLAGASEFEMAKVNVVLLCMEARVMGGQLTLSEEHDESAWVNPSEWANRELAAQAKDLMLEYARRKANR